VTLVRFVWTSLLAEAKLHGGIAVALGRSQERNEARTSLDEGGAGDDTVFVEQPGHAKLSAE
jgi:hypothetical protein